MLFVVIFNKNKADFLKNKTKQVNNSYMPEKLKKICVKTTILKIQSERQGGQGRSGGAYGFVTAS